MRKRFSLGPRRSLIAIAGLVSLFGCDGVVDPDGHAPGTAGPSGVSGASTAGPGQATSGSGPVGPGGPGSDAGNASTPAPGAPASGGASATPGPPGAGGATAPGVAAPASDPFTRLTRAEYLATVAAALDVEADATLIPVDGRVGPFTSNAALSADPVHPYLILAEELAALVVPEKFPVCEAASATACVRDEYRGALESLYRRPLSDAEGAALSGLVVELVEKGASAEDATRAMLSSALMSPDFLFRSALGSDDTASRGRRLAERLSFTLWDAPPDAGLRRAAEAEPAELGPQLLEQARRLARDARAVPVLARFLAQWLHLDVDLRLEDPAFGQSPRYEELLRFTADALDANLAVTSLFAGNRGFVHRDNLEAYGLDDFDDSDDDSVMLVTWPNDSPRRGLLAEELFVDATRHPDKSRRVIFRGRLVRSSLLCDEIPPPAPELIAAAGEVSDRTVDQRCAGCHLLMDPIGKAFSVLDADDSRAASPAEILSHAELTGSYPDLPSLFEAVASSRAFAECFAKNWLGFLLEVPKPQADPAFVAQLADAVQAGAGLGDIIEQSVATLETGSRALEPVCQAP